MTKIILMLCVALQHLAYCDTLQDRLIRREHASLLCQKSQCQRKEVLKHGHLADPLAYQVGPVVS